MDETEYYGFTGFSEDSRLIEVWKYSNSQDLLSNSNDIGESKIIAWLKEKPPAPNGQCHVAGLRLLDLASPGFREFPLKKETFNDLLKELEFPILRLHRNTFFVGGCEAFLVGPEKPAKISMAENLLTLSLTLALPMYIELARHPPVPMFSIATCNMTRQIANIPVDFAIGGGLFSYTIGGVFTYDPRSNMTRGAVLSGKDIQRKLVETIPTEFGKVSHPMTIPIVMAEIMMDTALAERDTCVRQIKSIERETRSEPDPQATTATPNRPIPGELNSYRSLISQLSNANRFRGRSQMSIERCRLLLEFAMKFLEPSQDNPFKPSLSNLEETTSILLSRANLMLSSIEHMKVEQQNLAMRSDSQNMTLSNLIAQQDVSVSIDVAQDSRELAAASRRDSSGMLIIAVLGTAFLPGTFIAAIMALPFFNWDSGIRRWIYPAVAIPLTIFTIVAMYALFRWRERRDKESAERARKDGAEGVPLLALEEGLCGGEHAGGSPSSSKN